MSAPVGRRSVAEETADSLREIRELFERDCALMDEVLDFVQGVVIGPTRFTKSRGLNTGVVALVKTLLAKSCKTFRAIKASALVGCGQDGGVLLRALFETAVAIEYILRTKSRHRAILYAAHGDVRRLVLMEETKLTRGQRRFFKAKAMRKAQAEVDKWRVLASASDIQSVRKHWAGSGGLKFACKSLGDRSGYPRLYTLMYRHLSSYSHGSDSAAHMFVNPQTGNPVVKLLPGTDEIEADIRMSCLFMLRMAGRFDKRLGCIGLDPQIRALTDKVLALPLGRRGQVGILPNVSSTFRPATI